MPSENSTRAGECAGCPGANARIIEKQAPDIRRGVDYEIIDGTEYEVFRRDSRTVRRSLYMVEAARRDGWDAKKENTLMKDGTRYKAVDRAGRTVDESSASHCRGCDMFKAHGTCMQALNPLYITCRRNWRYDGRDIIWKRS